MGYLRTIKRSAALGMLLLAGCLGGQPGADPLQVILASPEPAIRRVMEAPETHELQIRYTRIHREADSVRFEVHDYNVDPGRYFYPASMVKLPIAVLALEKLNHVDSLNRTTRYYVEGDSLEDSFAGDIRAVFAISDNHANNRLFEFLGQDAINDSLARKKIGPGRISHRLGYHRDDTTTRPLVIYLNDSMAAQSRSLTNRPLQRLELEGIRKGVGYKDGDSIYQAPFDFGLKNYLPLTSLDGILKRVIFPEQYPFEERFHLSGDQREFLLESMQNLPRQAGYDPELYPDGYCKFFMYGDTEDRIPDNIRIYNKVGFAFGTLTDCAYITDRESGVEFMLAATILVNENGIYNDDMYEYDETGIPFLAALGRAVFEYEKKLK